ncbi:hypothetical protein M2323_003563 [Rhodoblastus acidophilus]|uniref:hypothetical protein n=1 Tax=Rhodoblastus acidophilus TaxID=1074 RepID=UPI00222502F8|nr:hypothetical protein [Rhodoblastus acidophilus]MCW2285620.1 hypothetical protein [Rhodoblastus acidophilus]MCW2334622.1 hypothetical protein [Rhodoblastus acidophilus]
MNCTRYAVRRRSTLFAGRCAPWAPELWVSFVTPLNGIPFWLLRRRLHDAVDHRREKHSIWKSFGLIARWDGRDKVRGVACLARLGSNDIIELIGCDDVRALEQNDAKTVAQTLLAGPIAPICGSLKGVFLTVNPRTGARNVPSAPQPRYYEPMPFLF